MWTKFNDNNTVLHVNPYYYSGIELNGTIKYNSGTLNINQNSAINIEEGKKYTFLALTDIYEFKDLQSFYISLYDSSNNKIHDATGGNFNMSCLNRPVVFEAAADASVTLGLWFNRPNVNINTLEVTNGHIWIYMIEGEYELEDFNNLKALRYNAYTPKYDPLSSYNINHELHKNNIIRKLTIPGNYRNIFYNNELIIKARWITDSVFRLSGTLSPMNARIQITSSYNACHLKSNTQYTLFFYPLSKKDELNVNFVLGLDKGTDSDNEIAVDNGQLWTPLKRAATARSFTSESGVTPWTHQRW